MVEQRAVPDIPTDATSPPYDLAAIWEEGWNAGWDCAITTNPYRENVVTQQDSTVPAQCPACRDARIGLSTTVKPQHTYTFDCTERQQIDSTIKE